MSNLGRWRWLALLGLLALPHLAQAQVTPLSDNFDSDSAGTNCGGGSPVYVCPTNWTCSGPATVSTVVAHSSPNSLNPGCGGDGSSAQYNFPTTPLLSGTVDLWVYIVPGSGGVGDNITVNVAASSSTVGVVLGNGTVTPVLNGSNQPGGAFGVSTGTWHHYLLSWISGTSGKYTITVDGTVYYTYLGTVLGVVNQFGAASTNIGTGDYYIDDVKITGLVAKVNSATLIQ